MLRKDSVSSNNNIAGYLFIVPAMAAVILFSYYPVAEAIKISFYNHNGVSGNWVGMNNYLTVLKDSNFWRALWNTVYMGVLEMVFGLFLSLILASFINACRWGKSFFKSVYFVPNVISFVATSTIFLFLFYPDKSGPVNMVLGLFGISPQAWFAKASLAPIGIVIMGLWHSIGYNSIIWLAGLQSISSEYYEAASIDGASKIKQWKAITLPLLQPITIFLVVISMINLFKRFTDVYCIGGEDGSPALSLYTLMLYIYKQSFIMFQFGIACAASVIMFVIIMAITALNLKIFKTENE